LVLKAHSKTWIICGIDKTVINPVQTFSTVQCEVVFCQCVTLHILW